MTLLDDTLSVAADLGRAAAGQAAGAAIMAGKGISDAAHQGQAVLEDLGETVNGSDRPAGRRIMVLAIVAAIAGIVIWRRRSSRREPDEHMAADTPAAGPAPGAAATPELAMSPNVDVAARTEASR
jgi:hypothetical protein